VTRFREKPKERRETGQRDMFRSRLDQIIDLGYPLVKLAGKTTGAFSRNGSGRSIRTSRAGHRCRRG